MSTTLVEKQQALDAARKDASEFYTTNPTDKIAADKDLLETSKSHNRKMADLHDEVVKLQDIEEGAKQAGEARKSAGRAVEESDGEVSHKATKSWNFQEAMDESPGMARLKAVGDKFSGEIELVTIPSYKALLTLADLSPAEARRPGIVASVQDETTVGDLMLQGTTDSNVLSYFEETTFTNAAAPVAEGLPKPEATLDFTERTDAVRKIATWIPATSEFLDDNAGIRSYIEQRLRFMLARTEENQLLNGTGTAPAISGILNRTGIQTVAKAIGAPDLDALYNAITEVRVDGGAEPTAAVIHPLSWQLVRLAKDTNGQYHGAGPFSGADQVERVWGMRVRVTPMIAQGTALVGAFQPHAQIFRKGGVRVVASTEHASFFVENKVAILAEERLALAVYRPAAFCTVTGLGA